MEKTKKETEKLHFFTQFSEKKSPVEKVAAKSVANFVSGQAVKLSELVARFDRGQRLNVSYRPTNWVSEETPDERFEDAPPEDINDIVDVERYQNELKERKRDLQAREEERKKKQAQQAQQAIAQQAQQAQQEVK